MQILQKSLYRQDLLCIDSTFVKKRVYTWSLHNSKSLKVADFATNRKPVCDFLLVNNTNLHPISYRQQVIAD